MALLSPPVVGLGNPDPLRGSQPLAETHGAGPESRSGALVFSGVLIQTAPNNTYLAAFFALLGSKSA